MQTQFNKEIYNFKDNFWKGLTKRQAIWGGIGLGAGMGFTLAFGLFFGQDWAQVVGIAIALLCGFIGFYKRDGLNGEDIIYLFLRKAEMPKILITKDRYESPVMYHYGGYHKDYEQEQKEAALAKENKEEDIPSVNEQEDEA